MDVGCAEFALQVGVYAELVHKANMEGSPWAADIGAIRSIAQDDAQHGVLHDSQHALQA